MSERQLLYKSKSGSHQTRGQPKQRLLDETRKKRTEIRHAAYTERRQIQPTPQKLTTTVALNQLANDQLQMATSSHAPSASKQTKTGQADLSRQQAFRQRFKEYCEKKAVDKLKKKPTPFVSSVPTGRFLNGDKDVAEVKPIAKKSTKPIAKVIAETKVTKLSPINTRSKNLKLLSPSQLPRRKRRKSVKLVDDGHPLTAAKTPKKTSSNTSAKKKHEQNNNGTAEKKLKNKPVKRAIIEVPRIGSKPESPKLLKPVTDHEIKSKNKPVSALQITKPPVIPKRFVFQPASLSSVATSTAVKPRKTVISDPNSTKKNNSKKLFNESISPIENPSPRPLRTSPVAQITVENVPVPDKNENDLNRTPVTATAPLNESANYVSPFVTIARGTRGSNRKEKEARETKYTLNSRKSLNNSLEERQRHEAAQYFRQQMKRETDRLMALVNEWLAYKEAHIADTDAIDKVDDVILPSEYADLIDLAAGQTRLLTTNKFQQFRVLVDQCEQCTAVQPVKPEDLEGFWNMVYIQVENCDKRFERLRALRENDWQDPDIKVTKQKKLSANSGVVKKKVKPKSSRPNAMLSQMLAEARKKFIEDKKKEAEANNDNGENGLVMGPKRKSLVPAQLNGSLRKSTPRKNIWVVSAAYSISFKF